MEFKGIVIVGLGPASASSLTREAWDWLTRIKEIWVRTRYHPVFSELPEDIVIHSFEGEDEYESSNYASEIAEKIIDLAKERETSPMLSLAVPSLRRDRAPGHETGGNNPCPCAHYRWNELPGASLFRFGAGPPSETGTDRFALPCVARDPLFPCFCARADLQHAARHGSQATSN